MQIPSSNNNFMSQAALNLSNHNSLSSDLLRLSNDDAALMNAAKEFEGFFIQMMFRAMRDTVDSSGGLLPITESQRIFRDMLDEHISINAAQGGGFGLAQQIFDQVTSQRNVIQDALVQNGYYGAYGANNANGAYGKPEVDE